MSSLNIKQVPVWVVNIRVQMCFFILHTLFQLFRGKQTSNYNAILLTQENYNEIVIFHIYFSNSLIIHKEKTKEIHN